MALEVRTASISVPETELLILVTYSLAAKSVIPALQPVSLNLTGIVLPRLKMELPSGLTGGRTPDHEGVRITPNDDKLVTVPQTTSSVVSGYPASVTSTSSPSSPWYNLTNCSSSAVN